MEKFRTYLWAQIKRICRVFPYILGMTLLLTGCLTLLAVSWQQKEDSSDKRQKVQIGLVGDTGESYLNFGIMALQKLDSSRYAIDFLEMTAEEARDRLAKGQITAYVIIPEGFVQSVNMGENKQLIYATGNDSSGMGAVLMEELVDIISDLLTESQSAIYGTQRYLWNNGMWEIQGEATDRLFLRFVDLILGRDNLFEVAKMGVANGLSMTGYYFVGILILFLLFWGITCSALFTKRDYALTKVLRSKGQSLSGQVLAEYLAYLFLMLFNLFLMLLPVRIIFGLTGIEIPEWAGSGLGEQLLFLFKMIPVAAVIAALQFFLYELISDMVSGILLQFLSALVLGYLSGCFYPAAFFPESLRRIGALLPTGAAVGYGGKCMSGEIPGAELVVLTMYLVGFLGLSMAARGRRIKS